VKVEEAVERKPLRSASVVEVACSPVPSLVNGHAKVMPLPEAQPVQLVTLRLPIVAVLARRSVVDARPEI
jgi:hypothetical protein